MGKEEYKMKNTKYKIVRGNSRYECPWLVIIPSKIDGDDIIAEFWDKKDAKLFKDVKNGKTYEMGYNEAMKLHYRSGR